MLNVSVATTSTSSRLLTPCAFAVLLALSPEAWAAAGKVLFATGQVQLNRNGVGLSALVRGSELEPGDLVITGGGGFAQLLMEDGGRITLRANSQLRLDAFEYDGKPNRVNRSLMSLLTGSMRAVTGLIGHNNRANYKIRTPTATVGIRGSDGNIGYDPAIGASVQTLSGGHTLTAFDAAGGAHTMNLNPGDVGLVGPGAVRPVKVDNFPFATTLTPQARVSPTGAPEETSSDTAATTTDSNTPTAADESSGETRPAPADDMALVNVVADATVEELTINIEPAPVLTDAVGGLLAENSTGDTIVLTPDPLPPDPVVEPPPPPPPPPPIAVGLSPLMTGVVTATVYTQTSTGSNWANVDNQVVEAGQLALDANGNLTKYGIDGGFSATDYIELKNGVAQPTNSAGALALGSWTGSTSGLTSLVESWTEGNSGVTRNWANGQAGYYQLDPQNTFNMPLSGTMTYSSAFSSGRSSNNATVALTGATLNADFNTQTAMMTLDLSAGGIQWQAATTAMSLMSFGNSAYRNSFHADTWGGNLSVNNSQLGPVSGMIDGNFTGANFDGALVQYNFFKESSGSNIIDNGVSGIIGFQAQGTVTAPPVTVGPSQPEYVVVSDVGRGGTSNGLMIDTIDATDRGWSSSADQQRFDVIFNGGTVTQTGSSSNGLRTGTWTDGEIQYSHTSTLDPNSSWNWATMQRPQAWYLPGILSGSASYTATINTAPMASDGSVWSLALTSTALQIDFTNQKVDASIKLTNSQGEFINATTTAAPLQGADGQFAAGTVGTGGNGMNEGALIISRNGTTLDSTLASGRITGQLGGPGLANALLGYGLSFYTNCTQQTACFPTSTTLAGVVGFNGPAQNENMGFMLSDVALTSPDGKPLSSLGFSSASQTSSDINGVKGFNIWPDFREIAHLDRGSAIVADSGSHANSGMSWGRWNGTSDIVDINTGAILGTVNNVHYVNSQESGPALLPVSGSYSYTPVGNTSPTNQDGITGVLNNATLTADFTTRLVDVNVMATVAGTSLTANGTGIKLFDNLFHATSNGEGTGMLSVNCGGSCGAANNGAITGHFSGNGALGAGISYSLGTTITTPITINGVVAFERVP